MDSTKRISFKLKNPNKLFKQWLQEWIDEAEKKKKKISKTYKKALQSLEKYPLTIYNGHDCAILDGFGPKICDMLEEKLQAHLNQRSDLDQKLCFKDKIAKLQQLDADNASDVIKSIEAALLGNSIVNQTARNNLSIVEEENDDLLDNIQSPERENSSKENVISEELENLISDNESDDSLDRLINKKPKQAAKRKIDDCDARLLSTRDTNLLSSPISTVPGNPRFKKFKSFNTNSHIQGPSYASSPISKHLDVEVTHSKTNLEAVSEEIDELNRILAKYNKNLSPIGSKKEQASPKKKDPQKRKKIAKSPAKETAPLPQIQITQEDTEEKESAFEYISIDNIITADYDVILLIDNGEAGRNKAFKEIQEKLIKNKVVSDVRKLHVGDFLWIAKHKSDSTKELVLPYIIERKRIDDFGSSIKDGRFHEQKFRLKQCGIENVIYLVENYMRGGKVQVQCSLPFTTLLQAAANTQIQNKFTVKFTENGDHTILYLSVMTSFIENIFKNKKPIKFQMLDFKNFNQSSVKQKKCTVRETFIKQLLTLKGLSVDIALEITKYYPTPLDLFEAFQNVSKSEGENMLSRITIGELKRKIPAPISKIIYQFYMQK